MLLLQGESQVWDSQEVSPKTKRSILTRAYALRQVARLALPGEAVVGARRGEGGATAASIARSVQLLHEQVRTTDYSLRDRALLVIAQEVFSALTY